MMAALLFLVACESAPADTGTFTFPFSADPCDLDTPEVEVGIDDEAGWAPLEDGDPLYVYAHEHGGWYIVGGVSTYNLAGAVRVRQTVTDDATGAVVSEVVYDLVLEPEDGCASRFTELMAFLDVWELTDGEVEALEGAALTLHVEVSSELAPLMSAEVHVRAAAA